MPILAATAAACRGRDTISFISADGVEHYLDPVKDGAIISAEGEGMPPVEYITQRGPFQHGETMLDYFLKPRTLQYIIRRNKKSRSDYWDARTSLIDMLRPNLAGPGSLTQGKLRRYLANGDVRQIDCAIAEGPAFVARASSGWDEWSYQEALRFTAFNPVWYDPTSHSQILVGAAATQLVFPITFPIEFSAYSLGATVSYAGTWLDYPLITVTGPISGLVINNTTTGVAIGLSYDIPAGVQVVFNLAYGFKTVTDNAGHNLIGYVTPDSDLASFALWPGDNVVGISGIGTDANTSIQFQWTDRYIGI